MRYRVSRYLPWLSRPVVQASEEGPPCVRRKRARRLLHGWLVPRSRRPRLNSRRKRRERLLAERAAERLEIRALAESAAAILAEGPLGDPSGEPQGEDR